MPPHTATDIVSRLPARPRLYAVSTADESEIFSGALGSLVSSLNGPDIRLVVVLRDVPDTVADDFAGRSEVWKVLRSEACGVSDARNIALAWLVTHTDEPAVVSFPDDDCRYTPTTAEKALAHFSDSDISYVLGAYGPSPGTIDERKFPSSAGTATLRTILESASSVTMFVRLDWVKRVGPFNPHLGVGTSLPGGEDTDILLRLHSLGAKGRYDPRIVILHEYKTRRRFERYEAWIALSIAHSFLMREMWPVALRSGLGLFFRIILGRIGASSLRTVFRGLSPRAWRRITSHARLSVKSSF